MAVNSKSMFISWLKDHDPGLYKLAIYRAKLQQGEGLGAWTDIFSSIVNTVKEVAPSVVNMQAQKRILDLQIERARAGQPPADVADYTPAIKISPEISAESEESLKRIAVETVRQGVGDMKNVFFIGGGLLLAFFLINRKR